ncbi:hypothetical protein DMB66_24020 [Actinoplanes sp. ATCC 53533]|nr:hypothetical protein DMB66_24020 [Actinoplanes sp. ATCC 53533]
MAEHSGFEEFYTGTRHRLITYLYAMTGDRAEAQDAAQEAYVRAWQRWSTVSGYDNPEAWVRTVVPDQAGAVHAASAHRAGDVHAVLAPDQHQADVNARHRRQPRDDAAAAGRGFRIYRRSRRGRRLDLRIRRRRPGLPAGLEAGPGRGARAHAPQGPAAGRELRAPAHRPVRRRRGRAVSG